MSAAPEEIVYEEPGNEIAVVEPPASPTLFGTADPVDVIAAATRAATPLAEVVRKQNLSSSIQGREHVKVEGWTLLGSMLGVFPVTVWSRQLLSEGKPNGWEARVEARTRDGSVVGAAEAQCTRDENQWSWHPKGRNGQTLTARDDYALRSMAQTRATSKALRQPLGFVMTLAGFDATPAEEMPAEPSAAGQQAPVAAAPEGKPSSASSFQAPASVTVPADAPFGSALTEPATDGGDPALVKVTFGKNAGKPLGELTPRSREWYAADGWAEKKTGNVSAEDRRLRVAARILCGLPAHEDSGPFAQ